MAGEYTDCGKEAIIAILPNEHAMTIKMLSNYVHVCQFGERSYSQQWMAESKLVQSIESDCLTSSCKGTSVPLESCILNLT